MKHSKLAALSVLALAAGAACAQSSVTLYGVIDTGVERISNYQGSTSSVTRMPGQAGGQLPSRWGVRGSEDLGNGLKANFVLESGFSPDKGTNNTNQGGRLFGRSAWVGLAGQWGQVSVGRQYTMYFWSLLDADPIGPAIYGLGSLDSGIPGSRSDNTVAYKGTFSGFTVGGTYSFGRDSTNCVGEVAGDTKACREMSVLVKYDSAMWGVSLVNDQQRGGTGGTGGLTLSSQTDKRTGLNGYVKLGDAKLSVGNIRRNNQGSVSTNLTPKTDLSFVEAVYAFTPSFTLDGVVARLKYKESADNSKATIYAVRGAYSLSKRTALYAMVGRISNKGSANQALSGGTVPTDTGGTGTGPGAGLGQSGLYFGVRHSF